MYRQGYSFAKEQHQKRQKILKISTFIVIPIVILIFTVWGIVSGLDIFSRNYTKVTRVSNVEDKQTKADREKERIEAYKGADIPYADPQGRFSIVFTTPFASDEVTVVIKEKEYYDESKKEADRIIREARKSVEINRVNYKQENEIY